MSSSAKPAGFSERRRAAKSRSAIRAASADERLRVSADERGSRLRCASVARVSPLVGETPKCTHHGSRRSKIACSGTSSGRVYRTPSRPLSMPHTRIWRIWSGIWRIWSASGHTVPSETHCRALLTSAKMSRRDISSGLVGFAPSQSKYPSTTAQQTAA